MNIRFNEFRARCLGVAFFAAFFLSPVSAGDVTSDGYAYTWMSLKVKTASGERIAIDLRKDTEKEYERLLFKSFSFEGRDGKFELCDKIFHGIESPDLRGLDIVSEGVFELNGERVNVTSISLPIGAFFQEGGQDYDTFENYDIKELLLKILLHDHKPAEFRIVAYEKLGSGTGRVVVVQNKLVRQSSGEFCVC